MAKGDANNWWKKVISTSLWVLGIHLESHMYKYLLEDNAPLLSSLGHGAHRPHCSCPPNLWNTGAQAYKGQDVYFYVYIYRRLSGRAHGGITHLLFKSVKPMTWCREGPFQLHYCPPEEILGHTRKKSRPSEPPCTGLCISKSRDNFEWYEVERNFLFWKF